ISLPDAAAAGGVISGASLSERQIQRLLSCQAGFVTALQNCVVKIGRMRFACIERDDYALVFEINFHILNALNFHERPAQLSHRLMVIFALGGDFDRFQNCVIGALREKGIGWIGIIWPCRVHSVLTFYLSNVTAAQRSSLV